MRAGDESFERLRSAIDELAIDDAAELLADARAEARGRVRSLLTEALADSMLEHVRERLEAAPAPSAPRPAPGAPRPAPGAPRRRPAESAPRTARPRVPEQTASYVYGIVAAAELQLPPLRGVNPDTGITAVVEDGLAAIASPVDAAEFDEGPLREHLSDLAWVEATARAHEHVLDQLRELMTVIPMRMCTVYRSEDGVREMLQREAEPLAEALAKLAGKTEWSVKAMYALDAAAHGAGGDRGRPASPPGNPPGNPTANAPGNPTTDPTSEGRAYMSGKRRERDRAANLANELEQACGQIHARLRARADDALLSAPQTAEASGRRGEMLLNGVYLVDDAEQDAFHDEVRELQDEFAGLGLELETTGPWPAYNFVPGTLGVAW